MFLAAAYRIRPSPPIKAVISSRSVSYTHLDTPTVPLLLYRGSAEVGKDHSVMPHRKWRMEFQTDQFPDYDRWMTPEMCIRDRI